MSNATAQGSHLVRSGIIAERRIIRYRVAGRTVAIDGGTPLGDHWLPIHGLLRESALITVGRAS